MCQLLFNSINLIMAIDKELKSCLLSSSKSNRQKPSFQYRFEYFGEMVGMDRNGNIYSDDGTPLLAEALIQKN